MILEVDGVDILPMVQYEGYTVSREDLDGPNAGRTLDGVMHRDYVTSKLNIELQLRPLTKQEWEHLEHDILRGRPEHSVKFEDFGRVYTATMYQSKFNGVINHVTRLRHGGKLKFIEV
jgi:hypothetical protein